MREFLIDTNCLLSYLTDRDQRQCAVIAPYIEGAARLSLTLHVTPSVVTELIYVLRSVYGRRDREVADLVAALFATPGIAYLECHPIETILELWPRSLPDYGDAALAAVARVRQLQVLTFDKTFARSMARTQVAHLRLA